MTDPQRNKQQVSQQFSRAASSYDQAATIQQQALDRLFELLRQQQPHIHGNWLDIGCGTGQAFAPLQLLGADHIFGVDLAEGMLDVARRKSEQLSCPVTLSQADADRLPFDEAGLAKSEGIQGVVSSLMLQWSEQPQITLQEWFRVAAPGSTLAVATLLPGTHDEIRQTWANIDEYRHVNEFASAETIEDAVTASGWQLQHWQCECLQEHYDNVTSLLRGLKAIGATNVNNGRRPGLGGRKLVRQFEQFYPKASDGHCPLSYQVCWFIASKPA